MKRLLPAGLITFLQNNPNCQKADLFAITLPTGTTFHVTDGQRDIVVPSGTSGWSGSTTTFASSTFGRWSRGAITSEASFSMNSNTMSLTCVPQQGTSYPGMTIGLLNAAFNGLFDAATVQVYTVYMQAGSSNYGNVSNGVETKFYGTITKINDVNRTKVEFDVADPNYLLNEKIPKLLFQSTCPFSFADANCALASGNYTVTFTAASGSTQLVLTPTSAFSQAAGYFTQGVVTCTAGNNSGLSQAVKLHASGTLTLMVPWLLPVVAGDTFSVIAGCDKSLNACATRKQANGTAVNNSINFGGAGLFSPPPTQSL